MPGGAEKSVMTFAKPVRKCIISASGGIARVALKFSDAFNIPTNMIVSLDFQSVNNGGGVNGLYFIQSDNVYYVSVSVSEYGTGGNIDWYK